MHRGYIKVPLVMAMMMTALDAAGQSAAVSPASSAPQATPGQDAGSQAAPAPAAGAPGSAGDAAVIPVKADEGAKKASGKKTADAAATHLDEVIVTATKREQNVRKIPETITALKGKDLEAIGARELTDYLNQVPGVNYSPAGGSSSTEEISVRGVGPSQGANQTTAVLLGDVPLSDPLGNVIAVDPDPYDMKTVEILKGPQGTLFGASALNGAIRYVPNAPELNLFEGKAFYNWTSLSDGGSAPSYGGAWNAPLGSHAALRVGGIWQRVPGYIDYQTTGTPFIKDGDVSRKWLGRASLLWQPIDRLSITAAFNRQQRKADELSFVTNANADFVRNDAPGTSPNISAFDVSSVDMRYAFDWATLVSVSGYQTKKYDYNVDSSYSLVRQLAVGGLDYLRTDSAANSRGFLQELRLVSPNDGPWTWLFGAYFDNYKATEAAAVYLTVPQLGSLFGIDTTGIVPTVNGIDLLSVDANLHATERALFGEITRTIATDWKITLGGRLYKSQTQGKEAGGGLLLDALGLASNAKNLTADLAVVGRGFSPKLALTYQATRDVLFYGNVSRGFQFGGINAIVEYLPGVDQPPPGTFKSSTLWNYEAGIRTDWFDRTLRFDLTAFYLDWNNAQIQQYEASGLGTFVANVGKVHTDGVEATFRYLFPIRGLSFSTAASYIIPKTAVPYPSPTSPGGAVPAGTDMPNAPRLQTSSSLAYVHVFDNVKIGSAFGYSRQGKSYNDIQHDQPIDGYGTFDASVNLGLPYLVLAPGLTLQVTNLTNTHAIIASNKPAATANTTDLAGYTYSYNRPRAISLRFDVSF